MNENFEIPLKLIRDETLFSGGGGTKFGMEFQYKNWGFNLKKNFEIEPSLGMGIRLTSLEGLDTANIVVWVTWMYDRETWK